jgi:hypothetical protein
MTKKIVTYREQEWPERRLRRHLANGCVDPTPEGVMHALRHNGAMTAREVARMSSAPKTPDGMTKTERVVQVLKHLYHEGKIGMIEPPAKRGRPSYKFVVL